MIRFVMPFLLAACLIPACAAGRDSCRNSVKITVVETHNFNPVHPAVLFIKELSRAWETNEDGVVIIDSICDGNYAVHIHAFDYKDKEDVIRISGNIPIRIKVDHIEHFLSEVSVVEEAGRTILQSKEQLSHEELKNARGKNLADMLQKVTGVSTLSSGGTIMKPVIHGLHSNRIVMLNNGIRQEDQQWGAEHAPNIDPFLAERITVIKGAASVRYGTDAIGGVVLVEPAPLQNISGWKGEVNLAGFSNNRMGIASLMAEMGTKKFPRFGLRVQGTFKKGGNYRIPGHWVANTGVQENNFSVTTGVRKLHYGAELFYSRFNTDLGIYRGAHTGSANDLMNAINSPVPLMPADFTYDLQRPKQHVVHDLMKLKLLADNRYGVWNLIYGFQNNFRQEYDVLRVENGKAQLNLTLRTHTLNLNLDHKAIKGVKGQVGIDAMFQDNRFRDGDRLFIPTYTNYRAAAYGVERYYWNNKAVELGLRYDYHWYGVYNPEGGSQQNVYYEFSYNNLSGTLGYLQQLSSDWNWSATLSNAWRAPQANELFSAGLHHGAARIELGNKDLKPEVAFSLNVETKYIHREKLTGQVSVYSQLINNYIFLEPGDDVLTIRGFFKTFNYKQTNAWLNGTDLNLFYDWNEHLQSSLKGAFLFARDISKNDWLILMPSDRVSIGSKYSVDLNNIIKEAFVEVNGKYVWQQQRIPSNFDSIDFPRPPQGYFLLDASIGGRIQLRRQPVYISLAGTNLLNKKYRDYMDVFRYFIDAPGTNICIRVRVPISK